jgi:hypothetical protein
MCPQKTPELSTLLAASDERFLKRDLFIFLESLAANAAAAIRNLEGMW